MNYIGRDYEKHWDRAHTAAQAALYVSRMKDVCGIGLNRVGNYETGGYTYLHKRVPLYRRNESSWKVMEKAKAFNVMIYDFEGATPRAVLRNPRPIARLPASKASASCAAPAAATKWQ